MPKDTFYFSHDYTASSNPKISAMLQDYKAEGYGIFWHIIELLHQNDNHKLPLKKYIYSAIAKQMLTSVEQVSKLINDCIEEYELFYSDGTFFFSDRVNLNMSIRAEISQKRSKAGKISQQARLSQQTHVEQNSTKEIKGKESIIYVPLIDEVVGYFKENGYSEQSAKEAFNYYDEKKWHNKYGKPVTNWKNAITKSWFTPQNLIPQQQIPKDATVVKIDHSKQDLSKWR